MQRRTPRRLPTVRQSEESDCADRPSRVASTRVAIPPIRRRGPHRWRLECDWSLRFGRYTLTVPKGRETDLADVPGVLRPPLSDFGFGITGPLVHDFIYEHAGRLEPPACPAVRRAKEA